jgi:EAL domain-containing protein (putative c-di-GMP-specific phosphodiesterase class I)
MRNADTAMYHAKDAGPNRFSHYSKRMNEIVTQRLDIENGLAVAIERNAFEIHYQPVIDVGLGIVVGAEAFLRWRHPERGIIPPSEFIHHAEEGGLITAIGEWVLRTACKDAASWPQLDGRPLHLSVNISTRKLCEQTFPHAVMRTLRDPADATIIRGILTTARGLELVATAEGVETREQMELLYALGCHRMQGYLFAKPMPADEFAERIAAGETAWTGPLPDPG